MAEDLDNIILVYPRRIDEKADRLTDEVRDLNGCVTRLEERVASLELGLAAAKSRLDRVDHRLERVERRLDLYDGRDPKAAE